MNIILKLFLCYGITLILWKLFFVGKKKLESKLKVYGG